jgi:hypothetical protein
MASLVLGAVVTATYFDGSVAARSQIEGGSACVSRKLPVEVARALFSVTVAAIRRKIGELFDGS